MSGRTSVVAWTLCAALLPVAAAGQSSNCDTSTPKPDVYSVDPGQTLSEPAPGVLANDCLSPNDVPLPVPRQMTAPMHGSVTLSTDGSFVYVSDVGTPGGTVDSFDYFLDGGPFGPTAPVTVTLNINGANGPTTTLDAYAVQVGGVLSVPAPGVLGNDTSVDPATLTASLDPDPASAPQLGSVVMNPDGSFTYTHTGSTTGEDVFRYIARDSTGASAPTDVGITIVTASPAGVSDVRVTFAAVGFVESASRADGAKGVGRTLTVAVPTGSAPATATGTAAGVPPTTDSLVVRLASAGAIGNHLSELGSCERLAALAQARPGKYRLRMRVELGTGTALTTPTTPDSDSVIDVQLEDGLLACLLESVTPATP